MNLIVTCARHHEPDAGEEICAILEGLGDPDARAEITSMSGILTVQTALEPMPVVASIREMLVDEPWSVRYCMRIIPIQRYIKTDVEEIVGAAKQMYGLACSQPSTLPFLSSHQLSTTTTHISQPPPTHESGATYRISVEKRNSNLSSREIISRVAGCIDDKVSLNYPDRIILVEILGGMTGISVLHNSDILSVEKTKRSISDE